MTECPICGAEISAALSPESLKSISFGKTASRTILTLINSYPKPLTMEEIVNAVYWSDPNGGPLNAETVIRLTLPKIRKKLKPMGWTIQNIAATKTGRSRVGKYLLMPITSAEKG